MEIQENKIPEQDKANEGIARFAREIGRPLVATGDVHYLRREDYGNHAALLCVQTKSKLDAPKMTFDTNEFYLKSPEEMAEAFAKWPGSVENTVEVAERCELEIELGKLLLPRFPTPDGEEPAQMLRRLAEEGLRRRYGDPPPAEALERLDFELGVIGEMGFDSYFLIVWDFVRFAKENGVAVGPGRGSAAGSIVAYSLNITDLDPVENDLLFERFLNPARKSMPDIDIDFSVRGRERVIRYVAEKYGREAVAQIITFGKMAPRAATRDAARVLGYPNLKGDELAKKIPEPIMGRSPSFEECMKRGQDLRKAYDSDPDAKRIVDVAQGLEGIVRNNSIHAAAVVIADRPLQEIVPLQLAEDRSGGANGNGNGSGGGRARAPVQDRHPVLDGPDRGDRPAQDGLPGPAQPRRDRGCGRDHPALARDRLDVEAIPLDDPKTYAMLAKGDSTGVFQLESDGMREALKQIRPTEFNDIVAIGALYRPGAMRFIPDYAKGKRNPKSVRYQDDRLRPITEETYGCCIYQEQLMEIAKQVGGFSPAEADDLRKAVGKKKRDLMATMEDKFIDGCAASGTKPAVAKDLWGLMTAAADYSFNKSHAACYALISYRTAYLKANYPAEYMAAVISSVMSTKDKVPFFVNRCEEMGIEVLPPDVNSSDHGFVVSGKSIRFGLDAVKNVGHAAVQAIIRAREEDDGEFTSIWNFCERVDARAVNKRAIECLIKCGAFDSTGASRQGMLTVLPQAQANGQKIQEDAQRGQGSIFDLGGPPADEESDATSELAALTAPADPPVPEGEFEQRDLLAMEKETLGTYVTSHPLKGIREVLRERVDCTLAELQDKEDRSFLTVGGLIGDVKKLRTRSGQDMMFAGLDDLAGSVEMLIFNQVLEKSAHVLQSDNVVIAKGRLDHREGGKTSFVVSEVEEFQPDPTQIAAARRRASAPAEPFRLALAPTDFEPTLIDELKSIFSTYPGECEVLLEMQTAGGPRRLRFGREYRVRPSAALRAEVDTLLTTRALAA